MTARKPAFLQWLSLIVAMGIAVFFAYYFGIVARIWHDDASHMSSLVAALVAGTAAYIGWLCWRVPEGLRSTDYATTDETPPGWRRLLEIEDASEWGGTAADLAPALGLIGTVFGLSQQATALKEGGDVLALLGTALFSTLTGVAGFAVIVVLSHVLTSALRRARRYA